MIRPALFALGLSLAAPAHADVAAVVGERLLPGYQGFAAAATDLSAQADETCEPAALQPAWNAAFDAWLQVAWFHLGPSETDGRSLAIQFWPDPKNLGAKAQRGLLTGDPARLEPEAFADQSVAARGFMGLERLLFPQEPPEADPCALIRATAADLARMAAAIDADWQGGYARTLTTAGAADNTTFLTATEATQAIFTQLATGLEVLADQKLGRPLGTFDKPRPERAESRASGRSLHNVVVALQALRAATLALEPQAPQTMAAFDHALALAAALDDPALAGVAEPSGHLKVEILQQAVRAIREVMITEVGGALGVDLGFNSQDGD